MDAITNSFRFDEGAPEPLPPFEVLPRAEIYPVDALGHILSSAARAIASKNQVPLAMAAQSVLAAASLVACSHADVMMPFGQSRPLALYFITVAESGDRKSSSDEDALWPIRKLEKKLREAYDDEIKEWSIARSVWSAQKKRIEGDRKKTRQDRKP